MPAWLSHSCLQLACASSRHEKQACPPSFPTAGGPATLARLRRKTPCIVNAFPCFATQAMEDPRWQPFELLKRTVASCELPCDVSLCCCGPAVSCPAMFVVLLPASCLHTAARSCAACTVRMQARGPPQPAAPLANFCRCAHVPARTQAHQAFMFILTTVDWTDPKPASEDVRQVRSPTLHSKRAAQERSGLCLACYCACLEHRSALA